MKNIIGNILAKIVNKNVKAEVDAVCGFIGYQPIMPEKAKQCKKGKNK